MSLLDELPTPAQVTAILDPVLGSASGGTGVAGVLKLLESVDPTSLSASVAGRLSGNVSVSVAVDPSSVNGGALEQLRSAITELPREPGQLVKPLADLLGDIAAASGSDLPGQ